MFKTLIVLFVTFLLTSCLHGPRHNASLSEQWAEVEYRYPKIASAYLVQQAALANSAAAITELETCRRPCAVQVLPSFCDLIRSGLIHVTRETFIKTCGESGVVTDIQVPNLSDCWNDFVRCENVDVPADCDSNLNSCMSMD